MPPVSRLDFTYLFGFYCFFTVQFVAAISVFVIPLKRRKLFALRLFLSLLVIFGASFVWSEWASQIIILRILRYAALFGIGFLGIYLIFDVGVWTALFCAIGAYVIQHFSFRLATPVLYTETILSDVLKFILYFLVYTVIYVLVFLLCRKKLADIDGLFKQGNKFLVLFALAVLICVIVLSSLTDAFPETVSICYDLMCCLFTFVLMIYILKERNLKRDFDVAKLLWEKEKKQYELSAENVNLINIKCHDMKHYIERFKEQHVKASAEQISELEEILAFYDRAVKTGNEVIDVVLAERSLQCEKAGIRLSCMIDGGKLEFMRQPDIYSLFVNILDNAIAAAEKIEDYEKRVISLTAEETAGMIFLHAENYFDGKITFVGNLPETTNSDKNFHGFGMKSIEHIIKKYRGELYIKTQNDIFSLDAVVPSGTGK